MNLDLRLCCGGFYRWSRIPRDEQCKQGSWSKYSWQLAEPDKGLFHFKPNVEDMNSMRETIPAEGSKHSIESFNQIFSLESHFQLNPNLVVVQLGGLQKRLLPEGIVSLSFVPRKMKLKSFCCEITESVAGMAETAR